MTTQQIINAVNKLFTSNSHNYIFVYTPPKVGSTTIVSSLRISLGKSYNIIHIHDEVMLSVLTGINGITINDIINYLSSIGENVFVIDVYRTPIERKISEFFQKITQYHFNNSVENINTYNINRIFDRFNKLFPHLENGDHYVDKYNILEPIQFDFNKKYTVQQINGISYIKLRLCDSSLWANILSTIFKTNIILISDYTTDKMEIGKMYTKFKDEYKIPFNFLEEIKNNKYLKIYYNEEERNSYLSYWEKKVCEQIIPYSDNEFKFYINLCLENQYINDIEINHYIDNGCFCKYCTIKRRDIYFKAKNGQTHFEKIIHQEVINEEKQKTSKKIIKKIMQRNKIINQRKQPKTFNIDFK